MKSTCRFAILICVMIICACSGSAPELLYSQAELFLVDDVRTGTRYESLRLFLSVRDDDGPEDVATAYVDHAGDELYWEFDSSTWVETDFAGDHWVGMPDMRMPRDQPLPRGRYRVIVEDGAFQRSEGSFSITSEIRDLSTVSFPVLSTEGDVTVIADEPVVFRAYTRSGQMPANQEVLPGPVPQAVLDTIPRESGVVVYLITRQEDGVRLRSGPWDLPR